MCRVKVSSSLEGGGGCDGGIASVFVRIGREGGLQGAVWRPGEICMVVASFFLCLGGFGIGLWVMGWDVGWGFDGSWIVDFQIVITVARSHVLGDPSWNIA